MKWFKHFSDSLDDSFIQDLMDEHSHLGYAVWFGLLEIIAAENGSKLTGKVQLKPSFLRRKLRTSQAKLREVLEYCQSNGRLLADFSQERWELEVPKMLDLKDNYIKDLQVAGKKPSKHKEVEEEAEKEEEKKVTKEKNVYNRPPLKGGVIYITNIRNKKKKNLEGGKRKKGK